MTVVEKSDTTGEQPDNQPDARVVIKKYANRRLYNTASSSYVTLDHLCQMVKDGVDFVVYDAKTGEDITRPVLTQIMFEEETKGHVLLPISVLRQLIGFYGDSLQTLLPSYLEVSMASFSKNQEQMRSYLDNAMGGFNPFKTLEERGRQNIAMFQRAMSLFTPFGASDPPQAPPEVAETEITSLKAKLDAMQHQLDELAKK